MTTQTELLREALELADAYANAFNNYGSSLYNPTTAAARKALADKIAAIAQPEQPAPQGWKLVPVEPTDAMVFHGLGAPGRDVTEHDIENIYRAMLAASPTPPQAEQAEAAKPETERAELINLIVRDMGETDPADPQSNGTYWISESAMRAILENRLEEAALLSADSKDAGEPV